MRRTLAALSVSALLALSATAFAADTPIKLLIITGDNVKSHVWEESSRTLKEFLSEGGKIDVDITSTPSKDLTDENLAKYDVLLLNYFTTPQGAPESKWSDANKAAFLKAVKDGKGLVVYHFGSAAFARPNNWEEFEKAVAGGWRTQGYHGPAHEFTVKKTGNKHPASDGAPGEYAHVKDELYSNSMLTPGSIVLATAFCDPSKPRGTGKDEPVVWVNNYGKGRVFECVLGHGVEGLSDKPTREWFRHGVIWAATGKASK